MRMQPFEISHDKEDPFRQLESKFTEKAFSDPGHIQNKTFLERQNAFDELMDIKASIEITKITATFTTTQPSYGFDNFTPNDS